MGSGVRLQAQSNQVLEPGAQGCGNMSRDTRLRDWPDCLKRMTAAELKREREHWRNKARGSGHPGARKAARKFVGQVEHELASREECQGRLTDRGNDPGQQAVT